MVRYLGVLLACLCFTLGHVQELAGDISVPKSGDIADSDKGDVDREKLGEEELDEFGEDLFEEEEEVVGRKLYFSRSRSFSSSRSYYSYSYSRSRSYYYSYNSYGSYSSGQTTSKGPPVLFWVGFFGICCLSCAIWTWACCTGKFNQTQQEWDRQQQQQHGRRGYHGPPSPRSQHSPAPRSHHSPPRSPRHFDLSKAALPSRPPLDPNYLRDFIRALRDEYLRGQQGQVFSFLGSNDPGPHAGLFDQIEDMVKGILTKESGSLLGDRERFLNVLEETWELRSGFVAGRECDSYAEPLLG